MYGIFKEQIKNVFKRTKNVSLEMTMSYSLFIETRWVLIFFYCQSGCQRKKKKGLKILYRCIYVYFIIISIKKDFKNQLILYLKDCLTHLDIHIHISQCVWASALSGNGTFWRTFQNLCFSQILENRPWQRHWGWLQGKIMEVLMYTGNNLETCFLKCKRFV